MAVTRLAVTDFRCFDRYDLDLVPSGLTVLRGPNGAGKSSLLEALLWAAAGRSWRTATKDVLVRRGATQATVCTEVHLTGRQLSVEAVVPVRGAARVRVNRQPTSRRVDVAAVLRAVVFAPDDVQLVAGPPAGRRQLLDDILVSRHPRFEPLLREVDRVLRQRTALLAQLTSRPSPSELATLAVWDDRLARAGDALAEGRAALVAELAPIARAEHDRLTGGGPTLEVSYQPSWQGPLAEALVEHQSTDLRRGTTSVGPHRDDLLVRLDEQPARTHASQGEQRSAALALRLATFQLLAGDGGPEPILLLDDVFSELDPYRASALVDQLPRTQVLLSTAGDVPPSAALAALVEIRGGRVIGVGGR